MPRLVSLASKSWWGPCGGLLINSYYGVNLYVQYSNLRRRGEEILQMVLEKCAKGRAVLPSVFHLPSTCAHQIHSSLGYVAYYFISTIVLKKSAPRMAK
jgi:hypothetical protein